MMVAPKVFGLALRVRSLPGRQPSLEQGFRQPPDSARPWVYWFWLNGNITREGVKLNGRDLGHL
jgi:hypothetical protein